MKLANLLFGFLIFSLVLSLMFAATGDILSKNDIDGADDFNALAGEYEGLTNSIASKDSTARGIEGVTKTGAADSETTDVSILKGAVSGGRLSFNFFTNFEGIIQNATEDTRSGGAVYIDRRITNGLIFLIIIFLTLALLHFFRGFKTET